MNFFLFLKNLVLVEIGILTFLIIGILFHRVKIFIQDKIEEKRKVKIIEYVNRLLGENRSFEKSTYPGKKSWSKALLTILEAYEHRFQGGQWAVLRGEMVNALLLPKARKWARSLFWLKRNIAARSFALQPLEEDEEKILKQLEDPHFLVRSPASVALVRMCSKRGIEAILRAMHTELGFAVFFYRDTLLSNGLKVQKVLVELAEKEDLHKTILDVLGAKSWGGTISFLEKDLNSPDPSIRYLALVVLIRNPLPNASSFFEKMVNDEDPQVRALSLKGLTFFQTDKTMQIFEDALKDPVWQVGIEAGKGLKRMGDRGMELLNGQKEKKAQEVAQYVLNFG